MKFFASDYLVNSVPDLFVKIISSCAFTALSKAVFSHNSDPILNESEFYLDRIDFMVKRGQIIGIIGKVGSGKSSLLASILGELNKVSGHTAMDWPYR